MKKVRVLITGGPTRAYIDDVRFISNYSTGELAYETCAALQQSGMEVAAVIGPTFYNFEALNLKVYRPVLTSEEMHREVLKLCQRFRPDVVVFAAAVLDFVPQKRERGKVSSKQTEWNIRLVPAPKTIDIVGKKFPEVSRVGFKLEWKKPRAGVKNWGSVHRRMRGLDSLVLNYLPEVKKFSHRAYLFDSEDKVTTATSKKQIASWLVKQAEAAHFLR